MQENAVKAKVAAEGAVQAGSPGSPGSCAGGWPQRGSRDALLGLKMCLVIV